jgi:hypothetical protein
MGVKIDELNSGIKINDLDVMPLSQDIGNSQRKTLKATALQISNAFNESNLNKIADLNDLVTTNKIDKTIFNKFLPINGSKPMTGDLYMDGSTVSKYSAKVLTYTEDFDLTQNLNASIILLEKSNPTGNINAKIKVTINPNSLDVGFNVILIQTENTQIEIYGLGIVKILNPDGFLFSRGKYSTINLCVLKPNYVWAFGDMVGAGSINIPNIPTTTPTTLTTISGTGYLVASDNTIYDPKTIEYELYVTSNFKINALFRKNEFTDPQIKEMKNALDYWSLVLKDTTLPIQPQPSYAYDGERYFPSNPVLNTIDNDGYILYVTSLSGDPSLLGAASYYYTRDSVTDENTNHYRLPSIGFFYINKDNIPSMMNNVTPMGRTTLYYTFLHETCHALGVGTTWHRITNNVLQRSFIVGANDYSDNTYLNLSGNIFYTINRGNSVNFRTNTQFYDTSNPILRNSGDANSSKFAYNPKSLIGNVSLAVSAYNICFQTSLTAIPLENTMAWDGTNWSFGSYGSHWAEGDTTERRDARQYYGKVSPGAPALSDELMTPIVEDSKMDMPTSKITLGALSDLGWTVDMNQADTFDPYVIAVKYLDTAKTQIGYRKFNFGGYYDGSKMAMTHLRKSNTYTLINETTDSIYVYQKNGTILATINASATGTFTIPLNFAEDGLYISNANIAVYPWLVV